MALKLAASIDRLTVPGDLLEAAAREHARLGDFQSAYDFSQRANQSRQRSYSQEASNRAIAMQVSHETERARAEAEHQRGLTLAHAERLDTLERLSTAGKEITSSLEPAAIFAALDQHSRSLLDAASLTVYRMVESGSDLEMSFGVRAGRPMAPHRIPANDLGSAVSRCAREERATLTRLPTAVAPGAQSARRPEWVSVMCAPLKPGGQLLGVMSVESAAPRSYGDREAAIFRSLCAYAAIALANADVQALLVQKNRELQELSISDRLTGLFNRLRLDEVLQAERARHARTGAELAVVLIDLDDFKSVNDTHGHQVGDEVLVRVAALLQTASRQLDVVGRWGGEEFLVVCRDTDLAGAAILAEKLRGLLEQQPRPAPLRDQGTASFGVASLRQGEEIAQLLARADAALYRAKRNGRNRVELQSA
jgi:diguanylate cyclase (GGDEF)-like protein